MTSRMVDSLVCLSSAVVARRKHGSHVASVESFLHFSSDTVAQSQRHNSGQDSVSKLEIDSSIVLLVTATTLDTHFCVQCAVLDEASSR